jgi:lipopolysaccharide biosynthesis glycosyltransferase
MKTLPVFMAANDAYACFVATTIMSIAERTTSPLQFHLFDDGIASSRRQKLLGVAAQYPHVDLAIHGNLDRRLDDCPCPWYRTRAIFSRYYIADLFPEYDLSLYVDVDMIFQANVAELFSLGTEEHGLAACHDMCLDAIIDASQHKAALGIAPEHGYFNNGMILINGPVWRADRVSEHLTRIALERRPGVTFPSQDPMNMYFSPNNYRLLPPRWNSMPSSPRAVADPAVLHYTLTKPWHEPASPGADRFWEIARRCPFASEIWWKRQQWRIIKPVRRARRAIARFAPRFQT